MASIDPSSTVNITHSYFYSNNARSGGAIALTGSNRIENNTFELNIASGAAQTFGGAILIYGNALNENIISGNIVSGNSAVLGGGISFGAGGLGAPNLHVTILGNKFINNSTSAGGGAVFNRNANGDIFNNLFISNNGGGLGGAMLLVGTSNVQFNTYYSNTAPTGGALYIISGTSNVLNDIYYGNTALTGSQIYVDPAAVVSLTYSNIASGNAGVFGYNFQSAAGNTIADPMFTNASIGDFTLGLLSPLSVANGGTSNVLVSTDYTGAIRIAPYSMGAFEFNPPSGLIYLAPSPLGNDMTGNGSTTNPYQTIMKGLEVANTGNVIYFYPGTYTVNAAQNIEKSLTFSAYGQGGANSQNVIISGENTTGLFNFYSPDVSVTMNHLTLTKALNGVFYVSADQVTIDITSVIISGNTSAAYGAVGNYGVFNISDSMIVSNHAALGGIFSGIVLNVTNSVFINNTANQGGVVYSSTLNAYNCVFENNYATQGGGVAIISQVNLVHSIVSGNRSGTSGGVFINSNVNLVNVTANNNAALGSAGGVFSKTQSFPTKEWNITNSVFTENTASTNGGVFGAYTGAQINIVSSNFINNSALNGSGGVVGDFIISAASPYLVNVTGSFFVSNDALNGSVFYSNYTGTIINIFDSYFTNNNSTQSGGVLYATSSGLVVNVASSNFSNNTASYGGVSYVSGFVTWNIIDSIFVSNNSLNGGGVAYNQSGGNWNVVDSTFTGNNSQTGGGVAYNSNWNVTGSIFSNNSASQNGGVAYGGEWNVTGSVFQNNSAIQDGGVHYNGGFSVVWNVLNSTFNSNTAGQYGGVAVGNWNVTGSIFSSNRALYGGVVHGRGWTTTWNVVNSMMTNNTATQNAGVAGAMRFYAFNSVFANNSAPSGGLGASSGWSSYSYIRNCTIVSNNASTRGGIGYQGVWDIQNSILWGNTSALGKNFNSATGTVTYTLIENNDFGGLTNSGNNFSANPLFVSSSNLRLTDFSPAIDTGTNTNVSVYDFDGAPRIYGPTVDMGAYENQTHAFALSDFSPAVNATGVATASAVVVRIRSLVSTLNISSVSFNINNILYTESGANTFNFVDNSSPTTGDVTFTIQPDTVFSYSALIGVTINGLDGLGNSLNNYTYSFTTQAEPFIRNLNTNFTYGDFNVAIAAASSGDPLFVSPGMHVISSTIIVNKSLIISANAGTTTLNGQNLIKIMTVTGVTASILGLDFVSGNSATSGGLEIASNSTVTLNYVNFVGNRSTGALGAGGGGLSVSSSTVNARYVNFINNTNTVGLGGAVLSGVGGYLTMEDCQVVSNSAAVAGGIANFQSKGGVFNRLIVSGNSGTTSSPAYGGSGFFTYLTTGLVDVANTLFIGNFGPAGSAFASAGTTTNIYNSTFVNNAGAIGTAALGATKYSILFNNIFDSNGLTPFINGSGQVVTLNMYYSYAENVLTDGVSGNKSTSISGTPNFIMSVQYNQNQYMSRFFTRKSLIKKPPIRR
jgi:hypothetical protein